MMTTNGVVNQAMVSPGGKGASAERFGQRCSPTLFEMHALPGRIVMVAYSSYVLYDVYQKRPWQAVRQTSSDQPLAGGGSHSARQRQTVHSEAVGSKVPR